MRHKRSGITLFQLLIVIAILAILLGLMLPAVQRVRGAAARMSSMNNLKQIALAAHNHESANGFLPAGIDAQGFSGLAQFLPYIEQDNLYKTIDFKKSANHADNAAARKVRIPIYESPDDEAAPPDDKSGPTSYFLVAGSKPALEKNDGVFFKESKKSFARFTDGTSNTMMLLESPRGDGEKKAVSVKRQHVALAKGYLKGLTDNSGVKDWEDGKQIVGDRGASWMDGRFLRSVVSIGRKFNDEKPDVDCGGEGGLFAPRSLRAGTNIGMADGSVRYSTGKGTLDTWKAAAGTDDGIVIPNDF